MVITSGTHSFDTRRCAYHSEILGWDQDGKPIDGDIVIDQQQWAWVHIHRWDALPFLWERMPIERALALYGQYLDENDLLDIQEGKWFMSAGD